MIVILLIQILFFFAFSVMWSLGYFFIRRTLYYRCMIALIGIALLTSSMYSFYRYAQQRSARILGEGAQLHTGPHETDYPVLTRLDAGTPVRVVRIHDGWALVKTPEHTGWIQQTKLETIGAYY